MRISAARTAALSFCLSCLGIALAQSEVPTGWVVAGSAPKDYEFARDATTAANGKYSASIVAKPNASPTGFGTLMQIFDADNYRGGRWKLSGYLKTAGVTRAQMWMRVDGPDHKVLSFDNMGDRPVTGTSGWTRYAIVLDVPPDSVDIAFGFLLIQAGTVWADDFKIEKVDSTVPVTAPTPPAAKPKGPVNADFES